MTVKYSAWYRDIESPVPQMELPGAMCRNGTLSDVLFDIGKMRGLQSKGTTNDEYEKID